MGRLTQLIAAASLCCFSCSALPSGWVLARSSHFEVYSQAGPDRARLALTQFEELRSFFDHNQVVQTGAGLAEKSPLRVIGFSSRKEYDAVKLRATADAYYTGTADRDYIVMLMLGTDDFGIAAHEYAHFLLHSRGLKLPAWLNEGLAEFFSTVSITNRRCQFGGQIPTRVETLRQHSWLPASELFAAEPNSPLRDDRGGAAIFYAESWALADMLTSSPQYAPHFTDLIRILTSGALNSQQALAKVYSKSPDAILIDLQDWIDHSRSSRRALSPLASEVIGMEVNPISDSQARGVIADLLFANGEWDRAEQIYKDLLRQSPDDPEMLASLGAVVLRKGDHREAIEYWRKALDIGLKNAALCYRYALLAEEMDLPSEEIARALEEAIKIRRDFDDARYKLALLKSNTGDYAAAVNQLQAMAIPSAARAFGYWTVLSYALSELGKGDEAEDAAKQAMRFAVTQEERARAAELAYVSKTDLAVRFARNADGKLQMVTTRVPHGTTEFNPFIEAEDRIQVTAGKLVEVQCSEGRLTGFVVESKGGALTLSVPDPLHVLIRNGPAAFYCGPHVATGVKVEYATGAKSDTGLLRGMEFQ